MSRPVTHNKVLQMGKEQEMYVSQLSEVVLFIPAALAPRLKDSSVLPILRRRMDDALTVCHPFGIQFGIRWFERRLSDVFIDASDLEVRYHSSGTIVASGNSTAEFYFTVEFIDEQEQK